METKGYIIYNYTQKNQEIFKGQIESFVSKFKTLNIELIPVNNFDAYEIIINDKEAKFVLFWDKDFALMHLLEGKNIKIFNNVNALSICDDKALSYSRFIKNKVPTPITYVLPQTFNKPMVDYLDIIETKINKIGIKYPLIVKQRRSSLGLGVFLIKNKSELKKIIDEKWNKELLIQQYIDYEVGKDYRVYLINNKIKAVVTRINENDFRSNIEQGAKMFKVDFPNDELIKIAIKASLATKLDFGAVDIVKDSSGQYKVLEVNTNARLLTLDKLLNIDLENDIAHFILENI